MNASLPLYSNKTAHHFPPLENQQGGDALHADREQPGPRHHARDDVEPPRVRRAHEDGAGLGGGFIGGERTSIVLVREEIDVRDRRGGPRIRDDALVRRDVDERADPVSLRGDVGPEELKGISRSAPSVIRVGYSACEW